MNTTIKTLVATAAGFTIAVALPATGAAQSLVTTSDNKPFSIGFEAVGAVPMDNGNGDRFNVGGGGAVNFEYAVNPAVGVQAGVFALGLSGDMESTELIAGHVGARVHWGVWAGLTNSDAWIDLNASIGQSGKVIRQGFDAGIGYEFFINKSLRAGPMARWQWGSDPLDQNANLLTVGVSFGFGGSRVVVMARTDRDDDGVADDDDMCPKTPAGDTPDPERRGCPLKDRDGDGVSDKLDSCPKVPEGDEPDPDRPGCPLKDSDDDGLFDGDDECPNQAPGPRPDPDRDGCPAPDRDSDLVPDAVDYCPEDPGAPTSNPKTNGCPGLVRIVDGEIRILSPVFFGTNSVRILRKSYPVLRAVADAIGALKVRRIRVEGYADSRGSDDYNLELSQRRAQSVVDWLTDNGADEEGIEADAFGESRPMGSNATESGRAENRRVEFHILDAEFQR